MWIVARGLFHQLSRVLGELENETLSEELVASLRENIGYIRNPLVNKAKDPRQRALISKPGSTVTLANNQQIVVDEILSRESIILSDLFDINELDALELILTGELQVRNFNTLARGLCAVVCYYEAHRHFVLILKILLRLKSVAQEITPSVLTDFVDSLLKDIQLFKRVLNILQTFKVRTEFERLQRPDINGLGTLEHQRVLQEAIEDIERNCYEILCVFCHNCPASLQAEVIDLLFTVLRAIPTEEPLQLTTPKLAIWTSILIFINPSKLKHTENFQEILERFKKHLYEKWENPAACASIAFCFCVAIKTARHYPGGFRNQLKVNESSVIDRAMDNCAIQFLRTCVVEVPKFETYEVTVEVVDSFIKSFICYFPEKNQELFNICENELQALQETEDYKKKPNLYYIKFLDLITHAYSGNSANMAGLCEQFTMNKHVGLVSFVSAVQSVTKPRLFLTYIEMFTVFCKNEQVADYVMQLFNQEHSDLICDWNTLFAGMMQYLSEFRSRRHPAGYFSLNKTDTSNKMKASDVAAFVTWLRLAKAVAKHSPMARRMFYENHKWNCIEIASGMLVEGFPRALKGELYEFLAMMSMDERAAMRVWNSMLQKRICYMEKKEFRGIQAEFQAEKDIGVYSCTMGFLTMMNRLLSRKNIPCTPELNVYLRFITESVLGTFMEGHYSNADQLFIMLTTCMDALYELIRHFYVTTDAIANNGPQVYILCEILNDSPLSKVIFSIISECADRLDDYSLKNDLRTKMALSALRLLATAVSHRYSLVSAIRRTGGSQLVGSLEKIFLSPLTTRPKANYLSILLSYLNNSEYYIKHTFFVVKILRELGSQPYLHGKILNTFIPQSKILQGVFARLTSVYDDEIEVSPLDVPLNDLPDGIVVPTPRLRGEIARQVVELLVTALEADPKKGNITYLLCGFDVGNVSSSDLNTVDTVGESTTCLQSFIDLIEIFIAHNDPFNASFAALFEPTLRLLSRLLAVKTESSTVLLRYLRIRHDLIYKLLNCVTFKYVEVINGAFANDIDPEATTFVDINNVACTDSIYRRAVQGIILQMTAIEITSIIGIGLSSDVERYYTVLFAHVQHDFDAAAPDNSLISNEQAPEISLIWALLENSKADCEKIDLPSLVKFDTRRIDELLTVCLRENSVGVEQFDVQYLQFMLVTEVASVNSPDLGDIQQECHDILLYATRYNARRLLEGSCVHLLSGWVALVNAIAYFAPVNFIDIDIQKSYLCDGLYLLLKYTREVQINEAVASGISNAIFRLVSSITDLVCLSQSEDTRRMQLSLVLSTLIECLAMPEYAKYVMFKMDLYGSILRVFNACNLASAVKDEEVEGKDGDHNVTLSVLSALLKQKSANSKWSAIFSQLSEEIVKVITEDINFGPFQLKTAAATCMTEILREDVVGTQNVAQLFVRAGNVRCILSCLQNLKLNFNFIRDTDNKDVSLFFEAIMSLFVRLAGSATGWNALVDYEVLEVVGSLKFWSDIPSGFFMGKSWTMGLESPEGAYTQLFASYLQLCLALVANPYWRSISAQLMKVIDRNREFVNQIRRTHPDHNLVKLVNQFVEFVSQP